MDSQRSRRTRALGASLAVVLVAGALGAQPALAEPGAGQNRGPRIVDPSFDGRSWQQTQHHHAQFVSPGADGAGSAVQIGLGYADATTPYPIGGNLPVRGTGVDRGMVNKTIGGIKPNTTYRFSLKLKGSGIRWGIFDTEQKPYYRGLAVGDGGGEYAAGITTPGNGTQWQSYTSTITTGPRTAELNGFCFLGGNTAPGYCDDFAIEEVAPAAQPQTAPAELTAPQPAANGFPVTIPAVQSFTPARGTWRGRVQRVAVNAADRAKIWDEAQMGAANLQGAGVADRVTISQADRPNAANQVFVRLGAVPLPANAPANVQREDAYQIEIGRDGIVVTAGGEPGVLYALNTLGQALVGSTQKGARRPGLPYGTAVSWTDMKFRALQVDSGRRYYSIPWLKDQIKDLAWTNMNTMVLRVKDGQGLRVESDVFPELVDRLPDGGSWTKAEIADLVSFARQYHVTIIPEFDMPAHAGLDAKIFTEPGYMLGGEAYNYSRPDIRKRLADAAVEMGETFDSPYVHIGADEFMSLDEQTVLTDWIRAETGNPNANARDSYAWFLNYVDQTVRDSGRTTMVWNDQFNGRNKVVPLDKEIVIVFWAQIYGSLSAKDLLAEGRQLVGSSSDLYHDLWPTMTTGDLNSGSSRNGSVINRPLPEYAWAKYPSPFVFSGGWGEPSAVPVEVRGNVRGQFFPIWDDAHGWAPEPVLTQTLLPRLRLFAQTVWNSPRPTSDFAGFDQHLRYQGHAPYFGAEPRFTVPEQR